MKIYQIISEDYDNLALITPSDKKSNTEIKPSTSDVGGAIDKAADTATGYLPSWFNIDFSTLAVAIGAGLTISAVAKMSTAQLSKVSSQYAKKLELYDAKQIKWTAQFATPLVTIFKILGITTAITQLYGNLCVLEAMYVKGLIDETRLQSQRETEFAVFQTQILLPLIPKMVGALVNLLTGVKAVTRLFGGLAAGATAGASVVAMIATEAGLRFLQAWLGTESGRSWLVALTGGSIKYFGKIGDEVWDQLLNAYQGVTGKAPNKAVPGSYKQAAVRRYGDEEKAAAALAARDAKKKDNAGYVDGIMVTDQNGNLLSKNELSFDASLNLARQKAIDAGQPDPLAKFAKPGQALPPIN
jgi:hypothetical protein